jgi:hypothetical protein
VSGLNQGQGSATEFKQRGLQAAFSINLQIFCNKFGGRFSYFHFDLNCGSGYNDVAGCIGSPIAFLRAASSAGVDNFLACFVDNCESSLQTLKEQKEIKESNNCAMFHGDNSSFIKSIPEIIRARGDDPKYAVGMVLSDPNGSGVPIDELAWLSMVCPRLDFIVNWNSTIVKRCNKQVHRTEKMRRTCLADALQMLGKKHWLIRDPRTSQQWTLLVGRNIKAGNHRELGFFNLDTAHGQRLLDRCNYTRSEIPPNPQMAMWSWAQ